MTGTGCPCAFRVAAVFEAKFAAMHPFRLILHLHVVGSLLVEGTRTSGICLAATCMPGIHGQPTG